MNVSALMQCWISSIKVNSEKEKQQLKLEVIKKIFVEEKVPLNKKEMDQMMASLKISFFKKIVRKIKIVN